MKTPGTFSHPENSMYRGKRRFSREQLIFVVQVILCSATDRVDACLPTSSGLKMTADLTFIAGATEAAGMGLAVLYAQLTGDGLGIGDALAIAENFDEKLHHLYEEAWKRPEYYNKRAEVPADSTGITFAEIYEGLWPDERKIAETFVSEVFSEYIAGEPGPREFVTE